MQQEVSGFEPADYKLSVWSLQVLVMPVWGSSHNPDTSRLGQVADLYDT